MPDKEAVIIEASVLLVTLMFIILSVWSTSLQFIRQIAGLSFAIGFIFTVAALLATLRMFGAPQVFETLELVFFGGGLAFLAYAFFMDSATEFWGWFVGLAVISAVLGIARWIRHRRA